ncbi:MAG: ABC transporter permease [Candidatus Portnoybacteria bacterium]|nr:ABC transporter permease [Candidatus Portnoybacteria bacterium]
MSFKYAFKTAFRGLKTNKSRSLLTVLGIVIGITAIMLVMSLGQGAQDLILGEIQNMGSKTIEIAPGREPKGPSDMFSMFSDSLKQRDFEALENKNNAPHIARVMPLVFGSDSLVAGNETYRATIFGVNDLVVGIYDLEPAVGRFFTDEEARNYADVVVIGQKIKEELFGNEEAFGEKIKIKGRNFKIIGILPKKGQFSFLNFDEAAILPYTTAQRYVFGIKHYNELIAQVDSEENMERTIEDVEATLRANHNIDDPEKDDFYIQTQQEAMDQVSMVTNILTMFLAAVAAISLIVGGVGIMNIMLVSVTERTREIGLRKALGATSREILAQFLMEAIMLTVSGGAIGILLGTAWSFLTSIILSAYLNVNWDFSFPVSAMLLGLGVSALIGLAFGFFPARQAARKSPMEALRYE